MAPTTRMPALCSKPPPHTATMLREATVMGPRGDNHASPLHNHTQSHAYHGPAILCLAYKTLLHGTPRDMHCMTIIPSMLHNARRIRQRHQELVARGLRAGSGSGAEWAGV